MIYIDKDSVSDNTFTSLLEVTKTQIVKEYSKNIPKKIDGHIFEKLKIHGTFEQAMQILVRDKPNIQPQK